MPITGSDAEDTAGNDPSTATSSTQTATRRTTQISGSRSQGSNCPNPRFADLELNLPEVKAKASQYPSSLDDDDLKGLGYNGDASSQQNSERWYYKEGGSCMRFARPPVGDGWRRYVPAQAPPSDSPQANSSSMFKFGGTRNVPSDVSDWVKNLNYGKHTGKDEDQDMPDQ